MASKLTAKQHRPRGWALPRRPHCVSVEEMYRDGLERAARLGYEGYCTDCENVTRLHNGRCGCGSGRVILADLEDKP